MLWHHRRHGRSPTAAAQVIEAAAGGAPQTMGGAAMGTGAEGLRRRIYTCDPSVRRPAEVKARRLAATFREPNEKMLSGYNMYKAQKTFALGIVIDYAVRPPSSDSSGNRERLRESAAAPQLH